MGCGSRVSLSVALLSVLQGFVRNWSTALWYDGEKLGSKGTFSKARVLWRTKTRTCVGGELSSREEYSGSCQMTLAPAPAFMCDQPLQKRETGVFTGCLSDKIRAGILIVVQHRVGSYWKGIQ